jgi:hypothetical protein
MLSTKSRTCSLPYLQIVIFSLIFSILYIAAVGIDPASLILNLATFNVSNVTALRFFTPWLLFHLLPSKVLDTDGCRLVISLIGSFICFVLLRFYAKRILGAYVHLRWLNTIFFMMMVLHYGAVRILNTYYVYDIPAMILYMGAFLLLTSENRRYLWAGVLASILFSLNRETIVFSLFHAAAFIVVRNDLTVSKPKEALIRLAPIALGVLGIMFLRFELAHHLLGVSYADLLGIGTTIQLHEGDDFHIIAYMKKMLTESWVRVQILMLGCGIIIWLPIAFSKFTRLEKYLVLFSIPPFVMLLIAGNTVELRIYTECVPLMSLLFMQMCRNESDTK